MVFLIVGDIYVSTHVPARGGHIGLLRLNLDIGVSTHVPARGGHMRAMTCYLMTSAFQHTCPHEAGTYQLAYLMDDDGVSTHVPARGGHLGILGLSL